MALAIGDIWAFSLEQRLFGQTIYNTWACRVLSFPNGYSDAQFMGSWWGSLGAGFQVDEGLLFNMSEIQSNEVAYIAWHVKKVMPVPTNTFVIPVQGILAGTIATTCETANLAMSITRKGLAAGKRNRGRIAVAGVPTASIEAGVFTANILAEAAGLAAQCMGNKTQDGIGAVHMGWYTPEHIVVKDGIPLTLPEKYTDAVDAGARSTVRVQRSRTIGVGR